MGNPAVKPDIFLRTARQHDKNNNITSWGVGLCGVSAKR